MKTIILVCFCLSLFGGLFAQTKHQDIPQLDKLKKAFRADTVSVATSIELPHGIKALTIVFRETRWGEDQIASQTELSYNPNNMKKTEYNDQIWLISLSRYPSINGSFKNIIPPSKIPSRGIREMAFLGKGYGFAWFAFAPITKWIYIPGLLELQDGDDPIDAALRGYNKSKDGYDCISFLRGSLPRALPQIEKAIEKDDYLVISTMYRSNKEEVIQWLIQHSNSKDQKVADASRFCLIEKQKKEFIPMYLQWLKEDAGKKDVTKLLQVCRTLQISDLGDVLPVIMKSPTNIDEYRLAFEMERVVRGRIISKDLLESEKKICDFGRNKFIDQAKVDSATNQILASSDYDALAMIGLSLTIYFKAKANRDDYDAINKAGVCILKSIPEGKGLALVEQLALSCKDENDRRGLDEIVNFLRDKK